MATSIEARAKLHRSLREVNFRHNDVPSDVFLFLVRFSHLGTFSFLVKESIEILSTVFAGNLSERKFRNRRTIARDSAAWNPIINRQGQFHRPNFYRPIRGSSRSRTFRFVPRNSICSTRTDPRISFTIVGRAHARPIDTFSAKNFLMLSATTVLLLR